MSILALFASAFVLVFFLGLQSQVVRDGNYVAAFLNSFAIGACNLVMLKLAPNAGPAEIAAFLSGGPLGIVSSMLFHRRFFRKQHDRATIQSAGG